GSRDVRQRVWRQLQTGSKRAPASNHRSGPQRGLLSSARATPGQGNRRLAGVFPCPAQPGDDVLGMTIGRKYGIPDVRDTRVVDDEGEPPQQGLPRDVESRKPERTRQLEIGVGEDREWQAEPLGKLLLIGGLLRRKANDLRACLDQLLVMIAKGTRLGRAATCARNEVPTRRQVRFARTARPRIGVDHRSSAPKPGKGD